MQKIRKPLQPMHFFRLVLTGSVCLISAATFAADEKFVGDLALLVDTDVAQKVGLSDQTLAAVNEIIDARESEVLDLALEIKSLSAEEQASRLAPFVAESEKRGFALLTDEQRERFAQVKIAKQGMESLFNESIADQLNLADNQLEQLGHLSRERETKLRESDNADVTRAEYERRMLAVLTPTQRTRWEQLAGLAPTNGEIVAVPEAPAAPQEAPAEQPAPNEPAASSVPEKTPAVGDLKLRFSFRYAPWKDVLDWFADQAGLSLVMDAPPPGTCNYTDPKQYTVAEALDVLNSILLTKGYTIVRRQRMLLVVNLEDLEDSLPPNLVTRVKPEELDERGEYELVSCLFQLKRMAPQDAETEIRKLLGPQGHLVVMPQARQILVRETAGRLLTIRDIIDAVENPPADSSETLQQFALKHVSADEVMVVARQLLGIPEEQFAATDGSIRFAIDSVGTKIFATGEEEVIARFKRILELVDVPSGIDGGVGPAEFPQLEVYSVTDADPESVLQVMQTLLAGLPEVRLASDPQTGNLVALARPSEHATIRATLEQMQRAATQIEVIQLYRVDPQVAVLAINKLFGAADEDGVPDPKAPRVDADLTTGLLLIRATEPQILQIQQLLEKMGEDPDAVAAHTQQGNVRMLSITGSAQQKVLDQLQLLWPTMRKNRIRVVAPSATIRSLRPNEDDSAPAETPEAASEPAAEREDQSPADASTGTAPGSVFRFVAFQEGEEESGTGEKSLPDIIVAPGPGGIMIASEDLEALNEFENLLRTLAEEAAAAGPEYTVFYLRYAKAPAAAALLQSVLGMGGGDAAGGGGGGSLLGDIAGQALGNVGGDLLGGLLGLGGDDGTITTSGDVSIVADARSNTLIVQANSADLDQIEKLLQIIDQESSPEDVETAGKAQLIPVLYSSAEEIAAIVRQVYATRIAADANRQRQPSPEDLVRALRGGRGGQSQQAQSEEPKMTVGVDARSNSIIVVAPDPLFQEVRALVQQLDNAGIQSDETVRVVAIKGGNPEQVQQALESIIGQPATRTSADSIRASTSNASGGGNNRQVSEEELRRRIEFFRNLQRQAQPQGGGGDNGGRGGGRGGGGRGGR